MVNVFSNAIAHVKAWIYRFQLRQLTAVVLMIVVVLATSSNAQAGEHQTGTNKALTNKVLERVHENDSPRPKTTGEWNREDRETANDPDERGRRIGKQATAAFKEFGSGYVEATKDATQDSKESIVRAGEKLTNQGDR
jgi:hypothetical protein